MFPCQDTPLVKETDKAPCAGVMWREQSTANAATIRAWWSRMPGAIPAIDLAKSNLMVMDLDRRRDGPDGVNHFCELALAHGDALDNMPVVTTPGRGFHVYYRQPAGLALGNAEGSLKGKGINVRGQGGYVIAPGALRSDGQGWKQESNTPDLVTAFATGSIPALPEWLRNLITARSSITVAQPPGTSWAPPSARERAYAAEGLKGEALKVSKSPPGTRNNALNESAFTVGTLIPHYGLNRDEAETVLGAAALTAGLRRDEIAKTLKSGLDSGIKSPRLPLPTQVILDGVRDFAEQGKRHFESRTKPPALRSVSGDHAVVHRVSDVRAEPVRWLWQDRFAIGKLSILAGDPGVAKSQLTLFVAAKVSTGAPWPNDDGRPSIGNVVILSCEDDIADTVRPRLEVAGADLARVYVIEAIEQETGGRRGFSLTNDLLHLERTLDNVGDVALVIVDPVSAYLGGTDTHKNSDVRAALAPLQELAARRGIAVLAVSHFNKSAGQGKSINAITGSGAFVAASRATFLVTKDDNDPTLRLFVQAKNNLADAAGLSFRSRLGTTANGIKAPYVEFEIGTTSITADQAVGQIDWSEDRSAIDEAKDFLKEALADGAVSSKVLLAHSKELGISEKTLRRAAKSIGVLIRKEGFSDGWVWSFPVAPNGFQNLFATPKMAKANEDGQSKAVGIFGAEWPSSVRKENGS